MKKGNRTYKEHVGLFNIYSGTDTYGTRIQPIMLRIQIQNEEE